MNSKDIKKYNLINAILHAEPQNAEIVGMFQELAAIDFQTAFEIWEYILMTKVNSLVDTNIAKNIEGRVFEMFNVVSESKTKQLLTDSAPLMKLIYTNCITSCTGTNLQHIANTILSNKTELADELIRYVRANANPAFDYGEAMRVILDAYFANYCTKNKVVKPELNRKQTAFFLECISKIKGPNKNLLTQRIKEL